MKETPKKVGPPTFTRMMGNAQQGNIPQIVNQPSYKDKLAGVIPGAFAEAFEIEKYMEEDSDDDMPPQPDDGLPRVLLTREEKARIRAPWREALIVKPYGKSLEYTYLLNKLKTLWNPAGRLECSDIGHGFLIVKFQEKEDRIRVLRDGPWFVNQRFLTIRKWEPYFCPAKAPFSSVAVWIRLPGLPKEFYDPILIRRAVKQIGPLLRVDGITALGTRSQFARICVQIDLEIPIPPSIWIGKWKQIIQIEGIDKLCFHCGLIGHRKENCPSLIPMETSVPQPETEGRDPSSTVRNWEKGMKMDNDGDETREGHGPWTLVSNRRRTLDRKGKTKKTYTSDGHWEQGQRGLYPDKNGGRGRSDGAVEKKLRNGSSGKWVYMPKDMPGPGMGHEPKQRMENKEKLGNATYEGGPTDMDRMDLEDGDPEEGFTEEPSSGRSQDPMDLGQVLRPKASDKDTRDNSLSFTFSPFVLKSIADTIASPNTQIAQVNLERGGSGELGHQDLAPDGPEQETQRHHRATDESVPNDLDNTAGRRTQKSTGNPDGSSRLGRSATGKSTDTGRKKAVASHPPYSSEFPGGRSNPCTESVNRSGLCITEHDGRSIPSQCVEGKYCCSVNQGRNLQPNRPLAPREANRVSSDATCGGSGGMDSVTSEVPSQIREQRDKTGEDTSDERGPEGQRFRQVLATARMGHNGVRVGD